jgi:tetratricopeptide (TPR) repeat protein
VAYHFHEAGLFEKAADCWLQSARLAAAQSANMEAIAHARSGLAAVEAIPLGEARTRLELSLLLALGGPILAAKGWASRESDAVYQRAQMLSRELKDDKNLFKALQGQGFVHKVRGNIREAAQLMEKTVQLAGAGGDPTMRIEAYHLAGAVSYHQGKFETALNWFRQSIGVDEHGGGHHSSIYGIKMGVFDRAYISHCEWQIGHVDAALRTAEEALTLARGIEQPLSEIVALSYLAMLRQFRQEPVHAIEIAEQALRIGAEYRFDYYVALSALIRAWALVEQGAVDEGLEAYDFALGQFKGTGALLRLPHYLCLLAAAQGRSNPEAGLRTLEEAGEIAKGSQERWCDSELERTRGELRLIQDSGATAEAHKSFQRAVKLATRQGARMYELRARMSDARLWHSLGQRKKALEGLGAINDRLSEGQGTTDVRNAEALLKELRESVHEYRC